MSAATEQELRDMLGGAENVSSATISLLFSDSAEELAKQVVSVNDTAYSKLQRYLTAHYLSELGFIGRLASQTVGDVSVSFQSQGVSVGGPYASDWERMYQYLLARVQGMRTRLSY